MNGMKFPLISSTGICGINLGSYRVLRDNGYGQDDAEFVSGLVVTLILFVSDTGK